MRIQVAYTISSGGQEPTRNGDAPKPELALKKAEALRHQAEAREAGLRAMGGKVTSLLPGGNFAVEIAKKFRSAEQSTTVLIGGAEERTRDLLAKVEKAAETARAALASDSSLNRGLIIADAATLRSELNSEIAEKLDSLSEETKEALSAGITQESIERLIEISSQGTREEFNEALRKESNLTDEQLKEFDGMSQAEISAVLCPQLECDPPTIQPARAPPLAEFGF